MFEGGVWLFCSDPKKVGVHINETRGDAENPPRSGGKTRL